MQITKLSTEYELEIPAWVRERVELYPGQEFKVHLHGDHILLVPVRRSSERKTLKVPARSKAIPA